MINFDELRSLYEGLNEDNFQHIPKISCYNNNYYIGLKRKGHTVNDLLYAESDDDNFTKWYLINGEKSTCIGYNYNNDTIEITK